MEKVIYIKNRQNVKMAVKLNVLPEENKKLPRSNDNSLAEQVVV